MKLVFYHMFIDSVVHSELHFKNAGVLCLNQIQWCSLAEETTKSKGGHVAKLK